MKVIDEVSSTNQVNSPSLTTQGASDSPSEVSLPIATSEDSWVTPGVPSLDGGQNQPDTPADPKSVLESVAGNQDRAVDVLLGMSDPSYTSTERADVTQTELDEQLARRLMLEESEQPAAWRGDRHAFEHVPYQPRTGPFLSSDRQRSTEGNGANQFQEQLGKFAETGKKTFNTLLSKVKAKIQEFDNPAGQAQSSASPLPLHGGDSWSTPMQSQAYYSPNHPVSVPGYDLGATVQSGQLPMPSANQSVTAAQSVTSSSPGVSSSPSVLGGASSNVDPSNLGLLPKRPVALGSSAQPSRTLTDDDELEYVENPFEESAHR